MRPATGVTPQRSSEPRGEQCQSSAVASLAGASDDLHVGARNDRLTVSVVPEPIEAAGRLSRAEVDGRQDMYVGADEPLETADSAWFHEYVHSRQSYGTGAGMGRFDDASAEYYAALLAYEDGHVSEAAFYDYVRTDEENDAVLRGSRSVDDDASYFKGMRVLAALDADLREATGRKRTLQSVVRAMNAHDGTVDYGTFATLVAEAAGESRDEWLAAYVGSEAAPSVPDYLERDVDREPGDRGVPARRARQFVGRRAPLRRRPGRRRRDAPRPATGLTARSSVPNSGCSRTPRI